MLLLNEINNLQIRTSNYPCKIACVNSFVCVQVYSRQKAWKKVEGVMQDRRISRNLKGNIFSSSLTPAYVNGVETMALTEKQQEKEQVCETYLKRIFVGVKRAVERADKRIMNELKVEVGVKESS